ncbi:interleukin-4 receptor subunit alpha isoform 2-T4 [Clarias gariepinus]|nr:interleukin-4 receptor subunit alpha isoform X2 [Clarias gariepinus]
MTSQPEPQDALYWLEFSNNGESFECMLTSQAYPWVCVLNLSTRVEDTFMDIDIFQISLCYSVHGNKKSAVLKEDYMPVNNIQPVPPSNLMLLWKPDEAVFQWLSGYNEEIMLAPYLHYQLSIHGNDKVFNVTSSQTNMSVPRSRFTPNTYYTARVRSEPQNFYKGVWSHWGPAISWKTEHTHKSNNMFLRYVWLTLFLLLMMLLCYFSYTRWKRCVMDPSPAPHIGEFKCPVRLPENELLQREESLQIDSLTEELKGCENMSNGNDTSGCSSFTGSPTSPGMLQSSLDSKLSINSWTQVLMSGEKGSVTYSDDYCTFSHTLSEHAVNTHIS